MLNEAKTYELILVARGVDVDVIGARWVSGTLIAFELMHEAKEDAGKRRINGSARHPSALCRCEVAGFKPTCFFPSRPPASPSRPMLL